MSDTTDVGATPENPIDNQKDWVLAEITEYLATDGRLPKPAHNNPLLLLTTQGRKSGQWYRTCLIFGEDAAGRCVIVASKGGADRHPAWYLNLTANPNVRVQVYGDVFDARAITAGPGEAPALWDMMVEQYPTYADYKGRTDREIPLVILERL